MRKLKSDFMLCVGIICMLFLQGCDTYSQMTISSVSYQSVRTEYAQPDSTPSDARIAVIYTIDDDGVLNVLVKNLTEQILTIDKTKSFFVNTTGDSSPLYDATVRTSSTTDFSSGTKGMSVNLGSVAGALGVGGAVGTLLKGVNVGGSNTSGLSTTNTTYTVNQPIVKIGPKGECSVSDNPCKITNIGSVYSTVYTPDSGLMRVDAPADGTYNGAFRFSISLSYSFDDEDSRMLTTKFHINNGITIPVSDGKVNQAFKLIYKLKPDALVEPWFMFTIYPGPKKGNKRNIHNIYRRGAFVDFQ